MKKILFVLKLITILYALILTSTTAQAQFTVCNQSIDVVNVSVGKDIQGVFYTEGWWAIGANSCANVILEELTNRFVYIYAIDVFGKEILFGSTEMCIDTKRFLIRGIDSCWSRGLQRVSFFEVDTMATERWTLFLQD